MKIWIPYLGYESGASVYIQRLEKVLKAHDHEVELSAFSNKHRIFPYFLKFYKPGIKPDVVIADVICGSVFSGIGKALVIIEHHCIFDPNYAPYRSFIQSTVHELVWRYYERNSLKAADMIVCASEYTAKSVQQVFGTLPVKVIVNAIETDFYCPDNLNKTKSKKETPFKLLFVGNLIRRKGVDLLPKIMSKLGSDYELRYTSGLRNNTFLSTIKNKVALGHLTQEELLQEYRQADIFLFPTRFEGFGYAPAEAMSCGTPVVSTISSSIPEVVMDGETGILCAINDVDCMVEAIKKISININLYNKMKTRAREVAVEKFTMERWGNSWTKMLDLL